MRLGIFGDIHANIEALTAVHAELEKQDCDQLICLGDVVGYGASPGACIDFLADKEIACLMGNHDYFTLDRAHEKDWEMLDYPQESLIWTQAQLEERHFDWLAKLPYSIKLEDIEFIHSSIDTLDGEYWPYIADAKTAQFHFYLQTCKVMFCGHLHIPLQFTCTEEGIKMEMLKSGTLDLNANAQYLINAGSVGQARDMDWRAAAVIYDSETGKLELLRVEYDVEASKEKILESELPDELADRLSGGI